jgi:hypothetical protein
MTTSSGPIAGMVVMAGIVTSGEAAVAWVFDILPNSWAEFVIRGLRILL